MRHEAGPTPKEPAESRISMHEKLADALREMIVDGRLGPGARINEAEVAERFNVSRTPLREALKVLAAEGMVELKPHAGARVANLTTEDLVDAFRVIGALEGLAGELAAQRITEAELAEVRRLQDEMNEAFAANDLARYFHANQAVHDVILAAARNPLLLKQYRAVSGLLVAARYRANVSRERWAHALKEHEVILALLELRQSAQLGDVLRAHLNNKLEALMRRTEAGDAPDTRTGKGETR